VPRGHDGRDTPGFLEAPACVIIGSSCQLSEIAAVITRGTVRDDEMSWMHVGGNRRIIVFFGGAFFGFGFIIEPLFGSCFKQFSKNNSRYGIQL
jgi:hypothetical protein